MASWPESAASWIACRTSADPMPLPCSSGATASGPRRSAFPAEPAMMSQRRSVPISSSPLKAPNARPGDGIRPRRSCSQVLRNRASPNVRSSSTSRAAQSECASCRMVTIVPTPQAQSEMRADDIGLERREAVEGYGRIGRGIGTGSLDQNLIAYRERDRQIVGLLLVEHVGTVAGRARDNAGRLRIAVARRGDRIADRLLHGFRKAAELADVEVHPALVVVGLFLRDKHDLRLDDAGAANHAAARFDDGLGDVIAEMLGEALLDGIAVAGNLRHVFQVTRREAAAKIDHRQGDPALGKG